MSFNAKVSLLIFSVDNLSIDITGVLKSPTFIVLLVVWHSVSSTVAYWSLNGAGSWRWDGDLWEIFAVWYYLHLGGLWWTNVLNLALPPQRHRPDAQPEHQDPVIHTAQNKREKKRKKEREQPNQKTNPPMITSAKNYTKQLDRTLGQMVKAKLYRQNHTKKRSEERRVGKECRSRWSPYH